MIRKIALNTFFLSASQVLARAIGFFYFIFLARRLGVETFGIYTFTLAFVYNFIPVADFGLERFVLRDIPRKPKVVASYFQKLFPLRIFLILAAWFSTILLGVILRQTPRQIFYLAIFGLSLLPYSLTYLIASFQNAREKMEYTAVANIMTILLTAVTGFFFVLNRFSFEWILLAYFFGNLIVFLIFWAKTSDWNLPLQWRVDLNFWRQVLAESWVFAALIITATFYLRLSVVMTGLIAGPYLTGLYGSSFKFIEGLILIPQSLALALFPISSKLFFSDKSKLKKVYLRGLGVLFIFSLIPAAILFFFSGLIVCLAYGSNYVAATPAFSVLGLALVLFSLNALPGNIIQNSPKVKLFLPFALLNFLFTLVLCLILIPRYSLVGAAWAVVGGELAGLVINNIFVWRILKK